MCSSTRGPASVPSLVTCPTRNSAMPDCFAKRTSCAADSRTCATLPGADCRFSVYAVWMESITITAGFSCWAVAMMVSTRFSVNTRTLSAVSPRRCARSAICCTDSSPVTYNTGALALMTASACNNKVDLPMPGSPPISVTEPVTSPLPPSTRSKLGQTGTDTNDFFRRHGIQRLHGRGIGGRAEAPAAFRHGDFDATTVSTSVFQALQPGHWPTHLGDCAPHSLQL